MPYPNVHQTNYYGIRCEMLKPSRNKQSNGNVSEEITYRGA